MDNELKTLEQIQEYYGRVLKTNKDLKTSACCTVESLPDYLKEIAKLVHPEVQEKFYGCGSPIPLELSGKTILDLGSGSGRDCFVLSKLVGSHGRVIGIDMTSEQLDVARRHVKYHTEKFGYQEPNVEFKKGYIEDLERSGIKNGSIDVVVSNCVTNLSPSKEKVFSEIFRVLKPGGELYFSDVFATRRIPKHFKEDPVLLGECLGGALYIEDFRRTLVALGCQDYRVVARSKILLINPEVRNKVGMIDFYSFTIRAFKLDLEDRCEDYGQVAYYLGTIPESPHSFTLDDHHLFEKDKPLPVCSNTAEMLSQTRFAKHFKIVGDETTHYGLFNCGPTIQAKVPSGSCC